MNFVYKKSHTQTASSLRLARRRLWTVIAQGILNICTGAGPPALARCRVEESSARPIAQTLYRSK